MITRNTYSAWEKELITLTVLATQFHTLVEKMQKQDPTWDIIFDGVDASDFASGDPKFSVDYWTEKHAEKEEEIGA